MLPKHCELWLPGWIQSRRRIRRLDQQSPGPVHVYFCLADHFEPAWRGAEPDLQRARTVAWVNEYPRCAVRHRDGDGRHPQHSFFFPAEEYRAEHLDGLARLCRAGWGGVEVHLHHDRDTGPAFEEKLTIFVEALHHRHGLLRRDSLGRVVYAFIHGNWCLNNSLPDGRHCGVDDETSILLRTGCYADLTMPSGAHPSQTRQVNSIYYTIPRNTRRGHDFGPEACAGKPPVAGGLLMIQGPLGLNWECRKWSLLPRLECGDVTWHTPPSADRIRLWLDTRIHVKGAPQHMFIKAHTHGAQDRNTKFLLEGGLDLLWSELESVCRRKQHTLHYVTAYEMYLKIRELETGASGDTTVNHATAVTEVRL